MRITGRILDANLTFLTMTASFCANFGKEGPSLVDMKKVALSSLFVASVMAGKSSNTTQLTISCGPVKIGLAKVVWNVVAGMLASLINVL